MKSDGMERIVASMRALIEAVRSHHKGAHLPSEGYLVEAEKHLSDIDWQGPAGQHPPIVEAAAAPKADPPNPVVQKSDPPSPRK